jgi:hypothetical protein
MRPPSITMNPVGEAQRRGAVGDQHGRSGPPARRPAAAWDALLGVGVDRRGGVVQDEDLRVGEGGTSEGDALALAARQREAALADDRVVAVAQLEDELVGGGDPRRCFDLGIGRAGAPEGDVLADRRENRKLSSNTTLTVERSDSRVNSRASVPSRRTVPEVGS